MEHAGLRLAAGLRAYSASERLGGPVCGLLALERGLRVTAGVWSRCALVGSFPTTSKARNSSRRTPDFEAILMCFLVLRTDRHSILNLRSATLFPDADAYNGAETDGADGAHEDPCSRSGEDGDEPLAAG